MKDFMLGLAFMAAGAIVYVVAQGFPTMPSLQYGPSLFPSLIGGGFMIGGLILAISHGGALKGIAHGIAWRPAPERMRNLLTRAKEDATEREARSADDIDEKTAESPIKNRQAWKKRGRPTRHL